MSIVHLDGGLDILVREAQPGDWPYMLHSWKSILAKDPANRWARRGDLMRWLNTVCDQLVAELGGLVAANPYRPDHVLGWAVTDRSHNVVHFVYVASKYRHQGIARALLAGISLPAKYTFSTPEAEAIAERYPLRHVPSLLAKVKRHEGDPARRGAAEPQLEHLQPPDADR